MAVINNQWNIMKHNYTINKTEHKCSLNYKEKM
jgi:hypothetical protein